MKWSDQNRSDQSFSKVASRKVPSFEIPSLEMRTWDEPIVHRVSLKRRPFIAVAACVVLSLVLTPVSADQPPSAKRGYEALRTRPFLPPDFDEGVFKALWTVWPEPERSAAEKADEPQRRRMTMSYYGLIPESLETTTGQPATNSEANVPSTTSNSIVDQPLLGYVKNGEKNGQQNWIMNCLACHGGKVVGRVIPGLPNSHVSLQSLTEDVRLVKLAQGKKLSHLDMATLQWPLGTTQGTTNAVIFGIVLSTYRNPDMTVDLKRPIPPMMNHDMDAPPFWNVRRKKSLYADGHAPKTARPLMQFILLPRVTPETLAEWEPHFADILQWIESLEPPKYPFPIDAPLATKGERVFREHCARCHGTYGPNGKYEQQTIPLDEIGTDPVRWKSLTREHRSWMKQGWMSHFGEDPVELDPVGYVAPPLDGIWASAPYFHNGSVPTLWHVLHPDARPKVWKRTEDGYDQQRVGLEVETFDAIPATIKAAPHQRRYFNTRSFGKSASGHTFPNVLTEEEKQSLLEYLKTL